MPAATLEKKRSKPPQPHHWQMRLKELPREFKLAIEDFGMNKQTLIRYADQALRGDEKAIAKLEPLKQFYFELMRMAETSRPVLHEEGELAGKPFTEIDDYGMTRVVKESRSAFAMDKGYDLVTERTARKPRQHHLKLKVDEHFYSLCQMLEFLKLSLPLKFHGQAHPNPHQFKESHDAVAKGGAVKAKAFADRKALEEEFERVIKNTDDPARRDILEMLKPFVMDGKTSDWEG